MRTAPVPVSALDLAAHAESLRRDPRGANPPDWRVDWADGPWPVKVYSGGTRTGLGRTEPLDRLLLHTFGMTAVRFDPSGGLPATPGNPAPTHLGERYAPRRPIPSGGGMYPTEAYIVDTVAGIAYHYDPYRHELVDLRHPAPRAALRSAFGLSDAAPLPVAVLVLANRFWKNFYKYGDFACRLGAVDTGVALGRATRLAQATYGRIAVRTDFADTALEGLLGLDAQDETVFATVDLGPALACPRESPAGPAAPPPVLEKSRRVKRSPRMSAMRSAARHSTVESAGDRPRGGSGIRLPEAPKVDLLDPTTMVRRGSHGRRFTGTPVPADTLAGVLAHTADALERLAAAGNGLGRSVGVCCAVHRVTGVEPGWYRYQPGRAELVGTAAADSAGEIRRALFAESLNAELAAFTVHLTAPVDFAGGARGYRARQLAVGAAVEAVSLAAAALKCSGHAVLGFDVDRIDRAYRLIGDGVQAQVSVGAVRPSTTWEVAVMPR